MKHLAKILFSVLTVCCVLAASVFSVSAAAPVSLMPTAESGYTVVSGDGEVTLADGAMIIENKGDSDLRVTINNTTKFDYAALNTLHMKFDAKTTFKMAYHVASDDTTSGWANTSDNFANLFTIANDRAAAGEFDVNMKLSDITTGIVDKSSVYFKEFIIVLTGKGTFTVTAVEMTDGSTTSGGDTAATTTTAAQTESTTTTAAPVTTTTVKKPDTSTGDSAKTGDVSNAFVFVGVAAAAAGVVALTATKKSKV